jgi:hypothetical protein
MTIAEDPSAPMVDLDGDLDEEAEVDVAPNAAVVAGGAADSGDDAYTALVRRLSRQSVDKHVNPFVDIDWDHPDLRIEPTDPRWIPAAGGFAETDWYRGLDDETRARVGLFVITSAMKLGLEFENVLKRGLLEYALKLPNGSPEFRYLYHEVIEEAYHGLMFQEFVNRSGYRLRGMPRLIRFASRQVVVLARVFPPLFFLFVLGGEDPIDHTQRQLLRDGDLHPLVERIMRIHVTDEARHLSFARHHLKHEVPTLGRFRRLVLSVAAPILLGVMAKQMLLPPVAIQRRFGLPADQAKALATSPEARASVRESLGKVRRLCVELGLVTPMTKPLWRAAGIWSRSAERPETA